MNLSPNGYQVLEYCESCKLKAYPDSASPRARHKEATGSDDPSLSGDPWTIGFGDTGPDVVEGLTITQADANARLAKRITHEFEPGVAKLLKVSATQGQFDAFVDFSYNEGLGAFAHSTLLANFNRGATNAARAQFDVWIKAGGRVLLGLRRRRAMDKALFDGLSGAHAIAIGAALN